MSCNGRSIMICLSVIVTAELQRDKALSDQGDRGGMGQRQGGARVQDLNEQNAAVGDLRCKKAARLAHREMRCNRDVLRVCKVGFDGVKLKRHSRLAHREMRSKREDLRVYKVVFNSV